MRDDPIETPMTVKELIEILSTAFHPSTPVIVDGYEGGFDALTLKRIGRDVVKPRGSFKFESGDFFESELHKENAFWAVLLSRYDKKDWFRIR